MKSHSKKLQNYLRNSFNTYEYFKYGLSENMPFLPDHILIEPTNICNLSCMYCTHWSMKRKKKMMINSVFSKIVSQLENMNWKPKLTLVGHGEPLLHPQIIEFIKLAKPVSFSTSVITNGTVLNENLSEELIKSGLDRIQFSFDTIDKTLYEKARQGANFEKTLKNILKFIEINDKLKHPVYVSISSVQSKEVAKQNTKFLNFWKKYSMDNVYFPPLNNFHGNSRLSKDAKHHGRKQICTVPWTVLIIKADGNVTGCVTDYDDSYVIGNIMQDNLAELWNNEKMKYLRSSLIKKDFAYFKKIGHDCEKCNNSLIGCGLDDYLKTYFLYLEKFLMPFLHNTKF